LTKAWNDSRGKENHRRVYENV